MCTLETKSFDFSNSQTTVITRVDSLGQGVGDHNGHKIFIPKTVTGDVVEYAVVGKKKSVYFGKKINIVTPSKMRTYPECTHYDQCSGCDYQHISFSEEKNFKIQSLKNALSYLENSPKNIEFLQPENRFHYRNRIQLHYQIAPTPHIGLKTADAEVDKPIVPIPHCLLPEKKLQIYYEDFLVNWVNLIPKNSPERGHVELYLKNEEIKVSWNESYSHLGFTQVNNQANQLLNQTVLNILGGSSKPRSVLELFCGHGNLLKNIPESFRLIGIDHQGSLKAPHIFHNMDLYSPNVCTNILKVLKNSSDVISDVVIDPPRSGFNLLGELIQNIPTIERLIYVSCWPTTMVRDLNFLYKTCPWQKIQCWGINMFPATKHYESVVFIDWSK